ncbi:DUF1643 domain-containing protein [Paracoccus seriniphilus]|uniref:DUF1643 domain-containing protein n=1 Tax=Paracoccus seriniphilus TaxID=184748 RepID=A0A239PSH4_9RHOB|nr:DUF1643 domain-containing protein [Paracoccus seriniphilus]WCR15137.1 DUF1643 domain-containing protein [Paracoccus seriniphilus]SNT73088.1 hypothetical protein SAMN05444959_104259 [Paracoccus seriniphilus]
MITRRHEDGDQRSSAVFSDCLTYRYALTREWGSGRRIAFVMLNPSTADEQRNDPTIERCERRARRLGFGAMRIVNLFAYRATDPRDLKRAAAPVGALNDRMLVEAAQWADQVLCAWGVHGNHMARDRAVLPLLRENTTELFHLGLTQAGLPRHPLYVSYATVLIPWR